MSSGRKLNSLNFYSMSGDYHHQFSFSNGFERLQTEQQQHMAQHIRREKMRVQGFEAAAAAPSPPLLVGLDEDEQSGGIHQVYETTGMMPEMFNFSSTELLENQILQSYRNTNGRPPAGIGSEWYGNRHGMVVGGGGTHHQQQQISSGIDEAAMQLFLMNPPPPPPRSSSPSPAQSVGPFSQFTWRIPENVVEGQGLSLSLSSSLQHLEAAKAEELRIGGDGGGILYFNQDGGSGGGGGGGGGGGQNLLQTMHTLAGQNQQTPAGFGSSLGAVNTLRNSKYTKAAQELLEEFCSVGHKTAAAAANQNANSNNPNTSPSSSKDPPPLTASDRAEHQRRKVKLLSMLDEVERRYSNYCEQMQMVVSSFDMVMGMGSSGAYTCLAHRAMSRHFRCLKDAIVGQLKHSCEVLGEKAAASTLTTKGETPRLKMLEQRLRQQRAFHQMDQEAAAAAAWRPQRGLPERSVNILRSWLFEHFLHPYPSDADKHLLARHTGLSRNQVSNWFINARVRLWKPMVEAMYQQEAKEEEEEEEIKTIIDSPNSGYINDNGASAQIVAPPPTTTAALPPPPAAHTVTVTETGKRFEFNDQESDPSLHAILNSNFGAAGDVSLTLGLRHHGNLPEKNHLFD